MVLRQNMIDCLLRAGLRYWSEGADFVAALPVVECGSNPGFATERISLPSWAADLGVGSPPSLLVYEGLVRRSPGEPWQNCDWWQTAYAMLSCFQEREFERLHGPVHSNFRRLQGIDRQLFEHAWVNRIMLFLRRWAARTQQKSEEELFGPLPEPEIIVTHDIDAIRKTVPLRVKQGGLQVLDALAGWRNPSKAVRSFHSAARIMFSIENYAQLLVKCGAKSVREHQKVIYFVFVSDRTRNPGTWFFDPGYRLVPG
ncbi:MAG: hypothetical protein PHQ23_14915, partial [Candidatus Wallbacteria bacterium]|nr:hypothetical protein [Candidatus Wallbacteria bacterium]